MKERKKPKITLISLLIIAILLMTIAFAAMSQVLTINGNAKMTPARWKIYFSRLDNVGITGDAEEVTPPQIRDTANGIATDISEYSVKLTRPGDSITYEFDVKNEGDIDATLTGLTGGQKSNLTYTGSGATATADEGIVEAGISYSLTYKNTNTAVAENDTLNVGETKTMIIKISLGGDALPTNAVEIGGLGITFVYSQNANGTTPSTPSTPTPISVSSMNLEGAPYSSGDTAVLKVKCSGNVYASASQDALALATAPHAFLNITKDGVPNEVEATFSGVEDSNAQASLMRIASRAGGSTNIGDTLVYTYEIPNNVTGEISVSKIVGTVYTEDGTPTVFSGTSSDELPALAGTTADKTITAPVTKNWSYTGALTTGNIVTYTKSDSANKDEQFYVIDQTADTVYLLSAKLIAPSALDNTKYVQTGVQNDSNMAFSNVNGWTGTNGLDLNNWTKSGLTSGALVTARKYGEQFGVPGRLMTLDEVSIKVLRISKPTSSKSNLISRQNGDWVFKDSEGTGIYYWLGSAYNNYSVWDVDGNNGSSSLNYNYYTDNRGVRPVLEVPMSDIQ